MQPPQPPQPPQAPKPPQTPQAPQALNLLKLLKLYTNDLPATASRKFIYADDMPGHTGTLFCRT